MRSRSWCGCQDATDAFDQRASAVTEVVGADQNHPVTGVFQQLDARQILQPAFPRCPVLVPLVFDDQSCGSITEVTVTETVRRLDGHLHFGFWKITGD